VEDEIVFRVQIQRRDKSIKRVSNLTFNRTPIIGEKLLVHIEGTLVKCEITAVRRLPHVGKHGIGSPRQGGAATQTLIECCCPAFLSTSTVEINTASGRDQHSTESPQRQLVGAKYNLLWC
jgi:hypothetical protein